MADDLFDFAAIFNAARREEQKVTPEAVVGAVKEEEGLFHTEIRKSLLWVTKFLIYFGVGVFAVTVLVRLWHLLIPCWGWIEKDNLSVIDGLLKSGALVAAGGIIKDLITNSIPANKKA